jgi:hypothetical protein
MPGRKPHANMMRCMNARGSMQQATWAAWIVIARKRFTEMEKSTAV